MTKTNTAIDTTSAAAALVDGNLHSFRELLDAINTGVLSIAADIPRAQRTEILRELQCMGELLTRVMKERNLPSFVGSVHLRRAGGAA